MEFEQIYNSGCTKCGLCKTADIVCIGHRGQTKQISLIVCGEAPGTDEDKEGIPFVGKAGRLLDKLMKEAEINLDEVFYTNVVRCFPNENGLTRQPTNPEVSACIEYLYETLTVIKNGNQKNQFGNTNYIVALGNEALEALTGNRKISVNRGKKFKLVVHKQYKEKYGHLENDFTVVGVIHPSAVLRGLSVAEKQIVTDLRALWVDIKGKQNIYWKNYKWVDSLSELSDWVDAAIDSYNSGKSPFVAFDLETTGLICYDPDMKIVAFSASYKGGEAIVVPWFHKDSKWFGDELVKQTITELLNKLFNAVPVCGWNFLFDTKWLRLHFNIDIKKVAFDGFLARRWIYGDTQPYNDLNKVAEELLNFHGHGQEIWNVMESTKTNMSEVDVGILLRYAGGDADATYQLCELYSEKLRKVNLLEEYLRIPVRAIRTIGHMETNGVFIDKAVNSRLLKEFPEMMEPIIESIKTCKWGIATTQVLSDREKPLKFNLGSNITLQELLYEQMRLPTVKEGKSGASSDKEVIDQLIEYCEKFNLHDHLKVLKWLSEWRALKHTYNNFVKNIGEYTKHDGFFHTNYHIAGTDTGRVSSSKPSLHGQPKGSKARWQFVSRWNDGGVILSSDMSQAEMRVLASLSGDENLIDTIVSGVDLHTSNASKMFKIPIEEVTKKQRDLAKRAGFGVVYGIGAQTLASRIETSVAEAQKVIDSWYKAFPKTLLWQQDRYSFAKKHGYLVTVFGRIRHIEDYKTSRWGDKAWRQSINFPIQSSASDVTFLALLEAFSEVEKLGLKSKIFGFIHDAIITDVYPGELIQVLNIMKEKMVNWSNTTHEWIKAPMDADYEIGSSWGQPCSVDWDNDTVTVSGDSVAAFKLSKKLEKSFKIIESTHTEKDGKLESKMICERLV